ncbi:MAG: SurA N-terminal domain-containing protein [Deltaproteobacteria bacterium]|nr:SurA N-terminal domain-containing protein [Deltaproteobacteria bacterium]
MLNLMRKHARNWIMKVLLGIIIVVFIFYFGSMGGSRRTEMVATIDGKAIAHVEYVKEYQNLLEIYHQRFGDRLTGDVLKSLNLKQQALDNVINQAILFNKAEELNLQVTDEEIRASILATPAFQRDGVFDDRIYQHILRANKMTPEDFEALQRKMLTAAKLESLIGDGVKVSDRELYDLFRFQTEKIDVDYLLLSPKDFQDAVRVSEKDLESYLQEHGGDFRVAEHFQIKYITFLGQDFSASTKVSEEEIRDHYDRQKDKWVKPDGQRASLSEVRDRIVAELKLIRGKFTAASVAKKAHDTIYQEENFEAYAVDKGLTVRTTDFFPSNSPPAELAGIPNIAGSILSLQKDEISRVLSDERGYYLLKLEAKKPSHIPSLKDIRPEVKKRYIAKASTDLCRKEAQSILGQLKKGADMATFARQRKIDIGRTGMFPPGPAIPKLGFSQELGEALYQLSEKKPYPDRAYPISGNCMILKFRQKETEQSADFEAKKEALREIALRMKRADAIKSWIEGNKAALIESGRLKINKEIKDL